MVVRLLRDYAGQSRNTLFRGPEEPNLLAIGYADDEIEAASDWPQPLVPPAIPANTVRLRIPWAGQDANTLYSGSDQLWLVNNGYADYAFELAIPGDVLLSPIDGAILYSPIDRVALRPVSQ